MNKKNIIFISFICFLIDFISKRLVIHYMTLNESIKLIDNIFYLTYVRNNGVAFSFLEGNRIFIIVMSLIVLALIIYYLKRIKISFLEKVGFSLVIGGALGNLFDRIIYGYVMDFISIFIFDYSYPIFNIADTEVVIGVILIIFNNVFKEGESYEVNRRRKSKN